MCSIIPDGWDIHAVIVTFQNASSWHDRVSFQHELFVHGIAVCVLYPEWPHRQGGCLACCGCTFDSRWGSTDLYYARSTSIAGIAPSILTIPKFQKEPPPLCTIMFKYRRLFREVYSSRDKLNFEPALTLLHISEYMWSFTLKYCVWTRPITSLGFFGRTNPFHWKIVLWIHF